MAYTAFPLYSCTVNFRDRAQKKQRFDFYIAKRFAGVTEATARTKVLAVASALQGVSNALVQGTVLRDEETDLSKAPALPTTPYPNVEDKAKLRIQPVPSMPEIPVSIPVPKNVFVGTNVDIVDFGNTHIQDLLSFLASNAFDMGYRALVTYAGGERVRTASKILNRALPMITG